MVSNTADKTMPAEAEAENLAAQKVVAAAAAAAAAAVAGTDTAVVADHTTDTTAATEGEAAAKSTAAAGVASYTAAAWVSTARQTCPAQHTDPPEVLMAREAAAATSRSIPAADVVDNPAVAIVLVVAETARAEGAADWVRRKSLSTDH